MLGGAIAFEIVILVVGLLIVLAAMGAGVWVWLRRKPMKQNEKPEAKV